MSDKKKDTETATEPATDTETATATATATEPATATAPATDPRLAPLERAFEAGDYVLVRKLADELIAAGPKDVAEAARALRRRTEVDPVQAGVIAGCLVLFLVIAYIYVL
jgi:hypothetical protein